MTVQELFQTVFNTRKGLNVVTKGVLQEEYNFKKIAFDIKPKESSLVYVLSSNRDSLMEEENFGYSAYEKSDILGLETELSEEYLDIIMTANNNKTEWDQEDVKRVYRIVPGVQSYAVILTPWPEILGGTVILLKKENEAREEEMNLLAESIYEEMTFLGTEEKIEKEREELESRASEIEKVKDLPKGEFEKQFLTVSQVAAELREKFGLPEPSEEEKAEDEKRRAIERNLMYKDCIMNRIFGYRDICAIKEQISPQGEQNGSESK